ncbi:divalent-cation tolerance protein CutA [Pedosphaera parvula]|uniref:CutA1 divalent ion tolerance protein n=1 Tax=Pedosphaera parvula (strain Ellin514) TaxID=320771 RepID=B9XFH4_PEDPL|nr:divalent-cation tolerance protein CutA [Pedosphaera parvula]EEF61338.1 CutA1 divalent ion tolerance protein [Pedosphaera parvula Ellin514]
MKAASKFAIVLVTAPNLNVARQLSKLALEKRLVACANLIPKIESHYWWQGRVEKSAEVLVIMKSTKSKLPALEKLILAEHPYDTPEFLVLPVNFGTERYLDWITRSVTAK